MTMHGNALDAAKKLVNFLNESPTPFHATQNAAIRLEESGFKKIVEIENWEKYLVAGGKYYFTRNQTSLLAFTLPRNWSKTSTGIGLSIVATHIDSPNLRIRPVSKKTNAGYLQVGVETYGGGIWHSWLDRDLAVAGRVVTAGKNGFSSRLLKIEHPIIRIPTLAIHLDRSVNEALKFNLETEMIPILGTVAAQLNGGTEKETKQNTENIIPATNIQNDHHPALLSLLAGELSVKSEEIHDFELHLYDTQPSCLGGINNEFIFSPRMDSLFSSYCAVEALAETPINGDGNVNCIALFNHEEVGSVSSTGAESSLIPSLIHRLSPTPSAHAESVAKSFLISADMGHAIHPNFQSKHEENHKPSMNGGVVLKVDAKQRYTTDAIGSFLVKKLIERKGGRVQTYEVRNDMACGSTVGPMLSKIGMRVVDVGCGMLSMHSIREMAGSHDVLNYIDLFESFFEGFATLDKTLAVDI